MNSLTLGGQTYNKNELLTILQTEVDGDASLILAHQLIAAKLNVVNGADNSIASVIAQADNLLAQFSGKLPYSVAPSSTTGQQMVQVAADLDYYNNTCHASDGSAQNDNCPTVPNAGQEDAETDALGDACEADLYLTNPLVRDTDGDGCADGREVRLLTYAPNAGGDRDELSRWDFYDVPAPALSASSPGGARNRAVTLADVQAVLAYVGARDDAAQVGGVRDYDSDYNANGLEDGREYDRAPSWNLQKPWQSEPPNGAVALQDVQSVLAQVGHSCVGAP